MNIEKSLAKGAGVPVSEVKCPECGSINIIKNDSSSVTCFNCGEDSYLNSKSSINEKMVTAVSYEEELLKCIRDAVSFVMGIECKIYMYSSDYGISSCVKVLFESGREYNVPVCGDEFKFNRSYLVEKVKVICNEERKAMKALIVPDSP